MNIFKRLSLKYFNGSANLVIGEKRKILTDRDKAFIFACRKYGLNFDKCNFFDGAYFVEESDFNPKYSLIKADFSVLKSYNHFSVFIRLFSAELNINNMGAYRRLLLMIDRKFEDYFTNDIYNSIKEGMRSNMQRINFYRPEQKKDLWSCGMMYAFSNVYCFSIVWDAFNQVVNYVFVEIPRREKEFEEARFQRTYQKYWKERENKETSTPGIALFNILQINPTNDKTVIKAAYRKLVLIHHPDRGGSEEKFKQITEAYETLMKI